MSRLGRLRPRSIQARVALAIAVALVVVFAAIQIVFVTFAQQRARAEVEDTLRQQAGAIALAVERGGVENAAATARSAQRFIGDARLVVSVGGEVVHWNLPVADLEASAQVRRGDVTVLLERPDPSSGLLSDWVFVSLVAAGIVGTGALVWWLAGGVGARLRREVDELSDVAEAVARGRLDVRAPVRDDELGRLAAAFNRMTTRLEAAESRQREFLADVAHELRTPVTSIEGFAAALGDGTARTDEDRAESAAFIRDEAARLRALVSDLQEMTWLDLDPPVHAQRVDMAEAGREAVARLAHAAEEKGVRLYASPGEVAAVADPDHVATILTNLVANAIAATPAGGEINLLPVAMPGQAGIAVRDTGRGIAPEHVPYVFDRLYRAEPGRERRVDGGGSGLGLAIVRRLATLLGGRIELRTAVGEGATFTLWLPAHGLAPARRARIGSEAPTRRPKGVPR